MRFLFEARGGFFERVAEVVVGERRQDHAQGIGLVVQRGGAWRERALARGAAPELDDLELLPARAPAGEVAAAAVGAGLWLLAGERDAGDAGDGRRHTINSMCSPYHAAHGNRKASARTLTAAGSRILEGERGTERGVGRPFLLC